jgi:hypothetical protein
MTMKLAEVTLWQRNLASLVRSGLFERPEIVEVHGLYTVIGVYRDGSPSAPLAKYADRRRAEDSLNLVHRLIEPGLPINVN